MHNELGERLLTRDECQQVLLSSDVGRVVFTSRALPTAFPVSFAIDREDVVFRTDDGANLVVGAAGTVVAFEVDDLDPATGTGTCVVVTGLATAVSDADDAGRIDRLRIGKWSNSASTRYARIAMSIVVGLRLGPPHLR